MVLRSTRRMVLSFVWYCTSSGLLGSGSAPMARDAMVSAASM